MQITTTDSIPNFTILDTRGLVQGNTVRTKHLGRDIGASFKSLVGGELRGYTDMMTEARTEAIARMTEEATKLGANAILNVRFSTASVMGGAAEFLAYGTAVTATPVG